MILETRGIFLGNSNFLPDFTVSNPVSCKKLLISPKLIQFWMSEAGILKPTLEAKFNIGSHNWLYCVIIILVCECIIRGNFLKNSSMSGRYPIRSDKII